MMIKNFQNLSLSHDIHPRHIIEKQLKPKGEIEKKGDREY